MSCGEDGGGEVGDDDAGAIMMFLPLINVNDISIICWDEVIDFIVSTDPKNESAYKRFYNICMKLI